MSTKQKQSADALDGIATLIAQFQALQKRCNEYSQRRTDLQEEAKSVNAKRTPLDRQKAALIEQQKRAMESGDREALDASMEELRDIESEHSKNRARLSEIAAEEQRLAAKAKATLEPEYQMLASESREIESRIASTMYDLEHVRRTTLDRLAAATKPA